MEGACVRFHKEENGNHSGSADGPFRSFSEIAAAMHRLDVVGMIVVTGATHTLGFDVIGNRIRKAAKLPAADRAPRVLCADLLLEQTAHCRWGTVLPIPSRVMRVFDAAHSGQRFIFLFSPAADSGTVNRAELVFGQFHIGNLRAPGKLRG